MAIISINEIAEERGCSENEQGQQSYRRAFDIYADYADGPQTVRDNFYLATGIKYGHQYQTSSDLDLNAFCRSRNLDATESLITEDGVKAMKWRMSVEYGPRVYTPLQEPIEVAYNFAQWEEICDQDIHGNAVKNTATEPFDPPVMRDQSRPVLTISRNELPVAIDIAAIYKDKVNDGEFLGFPKGTVKCSNISIQKDLYYQPDDFYYDRVTYEFQIDLRGWKKIILNQGLRELVGGSLVLIKDDNGETVTSPYPLDETGQKLAVEAPPVYLEFEVYEEVNFGVFTFQRVGNRILSR